MNDNGDRHSIERDALSARVDELETRLRAVVERSVEPDETAGDQDAELNLLREALDDLKTDTLDLHNQLATVVSACERILAGAAGGSVDVSLDRGLDHRGAGFKIRRTARRLARAAVGTARRVLAPRDSGPEPAAALEIRLAEEPVTTAPAIAVVAETGVAPDQAAFPAFLAAQTDRELEVVLWNRKLGSASVHRGGEQAAIVEAGSRRQLADAVTAELIAEMPKMPSVSMASALELCRWTAASENLPLVVSLAGAEDGGAFTVEPIASWSSRNDGESGSAASLRAKLVGGGPIPGELFSGPALRPSDGIGGTYAAAGTGDVNHEVARLAGIATAVPQGDDRPGVLLVTPLEGAAGEAAMWALGGLADRYRFTVLVTGRRHGGRRQIAAAAELAESVYPVAGFLDPRVWPSLAVDLIRERNLQTVLRVGDSLDLGPSDDRSFRLVDWPLHGPKTVSDADLVLAPGAASAERATKAGADVVQMPATPAVAAKKPDGDSAESIRAAFGLSGDDRLVLSVAGLTADQRPEDVVAVAHRLRHLEGVHFLLIGEGELAGTVSDIARHFRLANFTLAPRTHDLFDLVEAADAVLLTGERDTWSVPAGAALALGRPLIASTVEGRLEQVEASGSDRVALAPPGDLIAMAAAVETAVSGKRPRSTLKAWKAAEIRSRRALELVADAIANGPNGAGGRG